MQSFIAIFTFKRFVFYGFPVYLVLAEYAMRFLISFAPGKEEEISLLAASNSVAAAGLSLIAPILIPKSVTAGLDAATLATLQAAGAELINRNDRRLIFAAYVGLLILPFFWGASLWFAHDHPARHDVRLAGMAVPISFLIAIGIYIIGMIYTELKEVVG
jgi:hypothetical protein